MGQRREAGRWRRVATRPGGGVATALLPGRKLGPTVRLAGREMGAAVLLPAEGGVGDDAYCRGREVAATVPAARGGRWWWHGCRVRTAWE